MADPLIGYVAAFAAGLLFGLSDVLVRVSMADISPHVMQLISLLVGTPFLLLAALLSGDPPPSMESIPYYILAGVLNFALGRMLFYIAVVGVGVSSASLITSPTILLSAILAYLVLGEGLSLRLLLGLLITFSGVTLATLRPSGESLQGINPRLGAIAGLLSVLVFASTAVIVRYAGIIGGAPVWGSTISYASALPFAFLIARKHLSIAPMWSRKAYYAAFTASIIVALAQLSRYYALTVLPVARAIILISLFPIHTMIISRAISRETKEQLHVHHALGGVLGFLGIVVAFY